MKSINQQTKTLAQERAAIARSGRLHWFHWGILGLSLALTLVAWSFAKHQADEKSADQFERAADQVLELVSERMQKYEDGLWAGVSAIQSQGGSITYESWRVFADNLRIDIKYPGINGIGVIHNVPPESLEAHLEEQRRSRPAYRVFPAHGENVYLPITYIEPSGVNAAAIGLDMAHEANRYDAAIEARDTGEAQITSPIVLVQGNVPGFLFFAPFYESGVPETVEDRRDRFNGMVYAPFVFHKLMEGILGKERRQVRVRISEADALLYDELVEADSEFDRSPLFRAQRDLDLYGKTWTFDIASTKSFRDEAANAQPTLVLIGGIFIDILLLTLFMMLTRANRRAVDFADRKTKELQDQTEALEASNAELEKFAYVTSHDLKTPLRGISDLTEYLKEDLEPYLTGSEVNPDIPKNLKRLRQQTRRMDGLIRGILDYSSVGTEPPKLGHVDSSAVVSALQADLGLSDDQIKLEGSFPAVTIDVVRFEQVMANLISNAIKYHDDPERALVTVSAKETDKFYVFSIADNGPGIDPKFHQRIFDVFQTLQTRDDLESTGIGLSIVKKAIETHGGQISVASDVGKGATFTFEWPKGNDWQQQQKAA